MSKKKFISGLESLFGNSSEKAFLEDSPLMDIAEPPRKQGGRSRGADSGQIAAKRSSKNFTSDLESLFEEALNETLEDNKEETNQQKKTKQRTQQPRRPLSGLDALIRRTEGMDYVEVNTPNKKRVTFVIDKPKLERLKEIARVKKLYLKDIIGEVMSKFIEKHEREKGETA